jgi:hypothetical protein
MVKRSKSYSPSAEAPLEDSEDAAMWQQEGRGARENLGEAAREGRWRKLRRRWSGPRRESVRLRVWSLEEQEKGRVACAAMASRSPTSPAAASESVVRKGR